MAERIVGIVVVGETVTVVDAQVPDDNAEPITIVADLTWSLQKGDRCPALAVLHQRCTDYLRENGVATVAIKASAVPMGTVKLATLQSAEVRGVVIAASASASQVTTLQKALISRTFGDRKVDDYLSDDGFWAGQVKGVKMRKMSREAAMQIIAARNR